MHTHGIHGGPRSPPKISGPPKILGPPRAPMNIGPPKNPNWSQGPPNNYPISNCEVMMLIMEQH